MRLSRQLQRIALVLLWFELLFDSQLQPLTAVAIPSLLAMGLKPQWLQRRAWLNGLTLMVLAGWAATTPLLERSAWLAGLSNLVWLMGSLKLLEAQQRRQLQRCSLIILMGIGLAGITSQGLGASLMQGGSALLCVTALVALEAGPQPMSGLLRRCVLLVGMLVPLVVSAFLLLPRLPVLWNLPEGGIGESGLSERLYPGDLAQLVQGGGMAARVQFRQGPPPPQQRYWRVLVHQQFDGRGWSQASQGEFPVLPLASPPGAAWVPDQSWLLEPSPLSWRPWGGSGTPGNPQWRISEQGALWAGQALDARAFYAIGSTEQPAAWRQSPPEPIDLTLPKGSNPKLEALGALWRQQSPDPVGRIQLAQRWFQGQPFEYSLAPGNLPAKAPLDHFLFERRLGFCEHYAASFAALMRAAGVPARVVVGYQGGRWQKPIAAEPYLLLEQSDAHAWSEVWLPQRGWVEVDPTAWIVPERIRQSLAASLSRADRSRLSRGRPPTWLQQMANQWQGLDTRWQLWVMQFDSQRQKELLPLWLQGPWQGLIAVLTIGVSLGIAVVFILQLERRDTTADSLRQALNRCLWPLRRLQLQPEAGETLASFCQRAGRTDQRLRDPLQQLCALYNGQRFNPGDPAARQVKAEMRRIRSHLWELVHRRKGAI